MRSESLTVATSKVGAKASNSASRCAGKNFGMPTASRCTASNTIAAVRHGYKMGARQPVLYSLVPALVKEMGEAYPELKRGKSQNRQMGSN